MKPFTSIFLTIAIGVTAAAHSQVINKPFNEGVIYSLTSFPEHPLNDTLKKIDFANGDFLAQYNLIQELKKHQQSIQGYNEQDVRDAFFASGMMILPLYSKTYFTPKEMRVSTMALGFQQETYLNTNTNAGKIVIKDRDDENRGTVIFDLPEIRKAWQKYQVESTQYNIQKTNETANVAGYSCKKAIYTFKGTSFQQPSTNVVRLQPEKVTVWYSDDINSSINLMHPLYFELDKAILKFEVEYDKSQKNKMLVEVTGIVPQIVEAENFKMKEIAPSAEFKKNEMEAGMIIMKVMMSAVSLLSK